MRGLSPAVAALVLAGSLLAAGCDSDDPAATSPTGREGTTAAPGRTPTPAPKVGACYTIDVAAGLELSSDAAPVPCSQRHTSVTVAIGTLDPVVDGHLLAVDAVRVQRKVARTCRAEVDRHVGGSAETQRLSRVQAVWFSPSLEQADTGALWFRCDLVVASDTTSFAALPTRTRGLLARPNALDRFGTCGTASPAARTFRRVSCSQPHTWRARATIDLPADANYLSRKEGRRADSACRDIEARRATTVTRLRWSFEWPTRAQWSSGQRHGLCWTPS